MIIDVHHHCMPLDHLENLDQFLGPGDDVRTLTTREGKRITRIYRNEMPLITITPLRGDMEQQIKHMDEAKVDLAILSIATWMDFLTMKNCRLVNNRIAEIVEKYPDRFVGMAHVPIGEDDSGALEELDRAVRDLGLKGVCITTNFRGIYPDEEAYNTFYDKVSRLNIPIFVHAAGASIDNRAIRKYDMNINVGRVYDHTVAALRILYSDVLERFPNLRFVHAHLGGSLFAIKERYLTPNTEAPDVIPKKDYEALLRKHFYYDTAPALWSQAELICAIETLGADHILLGSDYPIRQNWMKDTVKLVESLGDKVSDSEVEKILYKNCAELYGIK